MINAYIIARTSGVKDISIAKLDRDLAEIIIFNKEKRK